jgi:hypothetical protein
MKFIFAIVKRGQIALLAAVMALLAVPGYAQSARLELRNLEKLSSKAAEVTDVTLDGDLLQMAARFTSKSDDKDAHEVSDLIKGLTGIYVKSFEFDQPNQYTQADVEAIRSQLAAPGWSRIVQSTSKRDAETNEIYLMKKEGKIVGVAILVAEPKELTVVNIVGPIDIDKLSQLGGKFGVPAQIAEQPKHNKKSGEAGHEKK